MPRVAQLTHSHATQTGRILLIKIVALLCVPRAAEIWNGRVAMIAVTIYALEEAVTKTAVVSETPWLFEPFWSWGPTVIQF